MLHGYLLISDCDGNISERGVVLPSLREVKPSFLLDYSEFQIFPWRELLDVVNYLLSLFGAHIGSQSFYLGTEAESLVGLSVEKRSDAALVSGKEEFESVLLFLDVENENGVFSIYQFDGLVHSIFQIKVKDYFTVRMGLNLKVVLLGQFFKVVDLSIARHHHFSVFVLENKWLVCSYGLIHN